MKRLLSIMLMNAWGGLRQKASLPTVSLVGISMVALLVASTVTADASPHTNIPVVSKVANAVRTSITDPISSIFSDETPPKPVPPKKPKTPLGASSNTQQQPSSTVSNTNSVPTSGVSSPNAMSSTSQPSTQPATVVIAASALQCSPNTSPSSYTINVTSAQLSFQTPPTASGVITYTWDTLSSNGQTTSGTTTYQQQFTAGQASVTLSSSQAHQYLYTTSSSSSSYSFRLHITSPSDVTSSWVSVPLSTNGSCPSSNN